MNDLSTDIDVTLRSLIGSTGRKLCVMLRAPVVSA